MSTNQGNLSDGQAGGNPLETGADRPGRRLAAEIAGNREMVEWVLEPPEKAVSHGEAKAIMGGGFYGPERIAAALGIWNVPEAPIVIGGRPAARTDLEKAKEDGYDLVYFHDRTGDGEPLTMERIDSIVSPGSTHLRDYGFCGRMCFYRETPRAGWRLISKTFVCDAHERDYVEQTRELREKLAREGALTPEELAGCSDEALDGIREKMGKNCIWAAHRLASMAINRNHRCTPAEIAYVQSLRGRIAGHDGRGLWYEWSNVATDLGIPLVDSSGKDVYLGMPAQTHELLGTVARR